MNLQFAALILYSLLLIGLGLFLSRRVRSASDFLVAGRRLSPGLVFATFLAANIGAGSTVGAAGIGYNVGLSAWWWVGSAAIGSFILALTVGPKIWAIASTHNLQTVGDYLELRYSSTVRGVVAGLLWVGTLVLLAAQLIAISVIMTTIIGTPRWQGAVIGGTVVAVYFSAGGLLTSAWINALQLVVMFAGFLVAAPVAMNAVGGWSGMTAGIASQMSPAAAADYVSIVGVGITGVLGYLVVLVPSFIVSPGLIQKLYGARNAGAVRTGILLNALGLAVFAFLPPLLGMFARSQFPDLASADLALPRVMVELLPQWLGLLALAAVFSAEVSTCDAILFMLSSSLSVDLYKRFLHPEADEQTLLKVGRITSVAGIALGVLIAITLSSIIAALSLFYSLLVLALFVPLMSGLYSRRPTSAAALATMAASIGIAAVVHMSTAGRGIGILNPVAVGILAGVAVMTVATVRGGSRHEST